MGSNFFWVLLLAVNFLLLLAEDVDISAAVEVDNEDDDSEVGVSQVPEERKLPADNEDDDSEVGVSQVPEEQEEVNNDFAEKIENKDTVVTHDKESEVISVVREDKDIV